jgi:putative transposase
LESVDQAGLWLPSGRHLAVSLQVEARRSGCPEEAMKEIAQTRVRFGYRRIHVLLRREGWPVNAKRIYRLYRELGLQLRNKTPKRRVKAKLREDRSEAVHSNDVWAMDFVHDQLATGRKIRVLTVVDTFSRFSPVVDPRFSYRGEDVVETLDQACRRVGYPKTIRVDQGSEFISRDLDLWAYQRGVELDFSGPASPRTMHSSSPSTASSAANASTRTGS